MKKKEREEFLSALYEYTDTDVFKEMMQNYCREKAIVFSSTFHEGCRAGFLFSMLMHDTSKNKKSNTFFKDWIEEMASVSNGQGLPRGN